MKKTLVIATRILGWKVFSSYILDVLKQSSDYELDVVEYGLSNGWDGKPPAYTKLSIDFENFWRLKRLLLDSGVNPRVYDHLIVIGYSLAVPIKSFVTQSRKLSIVTDTTPLMAHRGGISSRGKLKNIVKSVFLGLMELFFYKPLFKKVHHFFVLSEKVKRSLMEDYGIPEAKISVLHPPIANAPVQNFDMPEHFKFDPVLLFIGNDFERKGGRFLLELYTAGLDKKASLIIVTADQSVSQDNLPSGALLLRSLPHEQIYSLIGQSTLLLFPTYRDELGLVLSEALKVGTPVVARLASAQDEFVKHEQTGVLLKFDSDIAEWLSVIHKLLDSPETLKEYRQNSLKLANQLLEPKIFHRKLISGLN